MKSLENINPSSEQRGCIDYSAGDLLVNGVPGAGKSIVLMKRALKYCNESNANDKKVVLLTSYGNPLIHYTKEIFEQLHLDEDKICISTMDRYCSSLYYKKWGQFAVVERNKYDPKRETYVSEALQNHLNKYKKQHRFYGVDPKFWSEEFLWIKQKNIRTLQQYIDVERVGRGSSVRITREERKIVYELFCEYCNVLRRVGRIDFEDIYNRIINDRPDLSDFQYDYVLVDEAQDMYYSKLMVARMLAKKSITIAADKAQKIYKTGFTWAELGIDIRGGASKTLHKTFRSTKQIIQLAESLSEINREKEGESGEYTDTELPKTLGADYPFIVKCADDADEKSFLETLINEFLKDEVTIGVLYRDYSTRDYLQNFFETKGIDYEWVKSVQSENARRYQSRYATAQSETPWSLNRPGVKLVTLHSSKGLEFDKVIIPHFDSNQFPLKTEIDKTEEGQLDDVMVEERKLLYVGITRAKSDLYLTYNGTESSFLGEFDPDYYNYVSSSGDSITKPERTFVPLRKREGVIMPNDTVVAHVKGEEKPTEFIGKKVANKKEKWPFIGKCVGEEVEVNGKTYVIDKVKDKAEDKTLIRKNPWDDVLKICSSQCCEFVKKLMENNVPVPTTVGCELMGASGGVIAEGELAWERDKVVFLTDKQLKDKKTWEDEKWTVITEKTPINSIGLREAIE